MRKLPIVFVLFVPLMMLKADVHESGSYHRVEQLGEKTFTFKISFDGADVTKEFLIDGKIIDQATYEQQKIAAGEYDVAQLVQRIQKTHADFEYTIDQIRAKAALKLLVQVRDACKRLIKSLYEQVEESYFVFDQATIGSAEFLRVIDKKILPVFSFCDDERVQQEDTAVLKKCADILASIYDRLTAFYKAGIQRALEHTDEPKALQKLLDLL